MSTAQGPEPDRSFRAPRKSLFPLWLLPLGVLVCLAGFIGFTDSGGVIAREALEAVGLKRPEELDVAESRASAKQPWDGMVHLTPSQRDMLGVKMAAVAPQSEPVRMEIQGKTDYNPDTIIKVRPRFDALVLAVHATVGKKVEKGDPLVELYSVQLAEAKLAYESKQSQAIHDRQIASQQRDLMAQGVLPPTSRTLLDAENNQRRSDLEFKLARDTLVVYGVSLEDIDKVAEEDGAEKAKMTLCAQGGGTIIGRDVVVGNIYDVHDLGTRRALGVGAGL
jgi:membrane fusion protein, heavy metal efflux system